MAKRHKARGKPDRSGMPDRMGAKVDVPHDRGRTRAESVARWLSVVLVPLGAVSGTVLAAVPGLSNSARALAAMIAIGCVRTLCGAFPAARDDE
jgi:hypothetical protein